MFLLPVLSFRMFRRCSGSAGARRESQRFEEERIEQVMQERRAMDKKAAELNKEEAERKRQEWLSSLEE